MILFMTNEVDPIPADMDEDNPDARGNPLALASDLFALIGFFGLFSCLIDSKIAIGVCFSAGLTAVILGMMAMKRRENLVGHQSTYAKRGVVIGGCILFVSIGSIILLPSVYRSPYRVGYFQGRHSFNAIQFGVAFHTYSDMVKRLPSPVYDPFDADFRPGSGLSWRVDILPFVEEGKLHDQFDCAQTWDSNYNLPASNTPVRIYEDWRDNVRTDTRWQVFVGPGTLFDSAMPKLKIENPKAIPDGSSNTIFLAEAATPVPWASPRDMTYVPNGVVPGLGHPSEKTVMVLFADGTVRSIKKTVKPAVWHALIQRNDGVTLPAGWDD
ncbi:hypothetical protein BH11PLA2_BH11PLA2_03350 [soil metagenome]